MERRCHQMHAARHEHQEEKRYKMSSPLLLQKPTRTLRYTGPLAFITDNATVRSIISVHGPSQPADQEKGNALSH